MLFSELHRKCVEEIHILMEGMGSIVNEYSVTHDHFCFGIHINDSYTISISIPPDANRICQDSAPVVAETAILKNRKLCFDVPGYEDGRKQFWGKDRAAGRQNVKRISDEIGRIRECLEQTDHEF